MEVGRFYAGVGALLRHPPTDRYLLLRRAADKDFASGVWECVTGRVNQGEGFEEAVLREVQEETAVVPTLEFILGTTHFYRGAPEPENELVGVVYVCTVVDPTAVRISHEHDSFRWVTADEAYDLLVAVDASTQWTRRVIKRARALLPLTPEALRAHRRQHGFALG